MSLSRFRPGLCSCLLVALLSACSQAPQDAVSPESTAESARDDVAGGAAAPAAASADVAPGAATIDPAQLASAATTQSDPARRFIRTAQVRFRVDDVYRSALAIEDMVAAEGGFVVANRIRSDLRDVRRRAIGDDRVLELAEYVTAGDLTVRVPSDRIQPFLRALAKQVTFLESRDFGAHDAQFDLLRQQLAFQRGEALQSALGEAVQDGDRLDRKADAHAARAQALAARDEATVAQREFEDRVAFATIDLSMTQPPQLRRSELPDTAAALQRHRTAFLPRLGDALAGGWRALLDVLVGLVALWPLWLVAAVAWAGWRVMRARRRGRPAAPG